MLFIPDFLLTCKEGKEIEISNLKKSTAQYKKFHLIGCGK
jgi:hypothetical protein